MIPNKGTHWTNSCKNNADLGGGSNILDIFFDIDSNGVFVLYLIGIELRCDT